MPLVVSPHPPPLPLFLGHQPLVYLTLKTLAARDIYLGDMDCCEKQEVDLSVSLSLGFKVGGGGLVLLFRLGLKLVK